MGIANRKGFTLMELLTVMAILITLLGIASVAIAGYQQRTRLRTTTESIAADIREARWKARVSGDVCTVIFFPEARNYAVNGVLSMELPADIWFGVDPSVTGKPSQPYEMPPDDGISFDSGRKNIARFYPTGTVSPTGSVYLTNGKETFAITVAITGRPKIWRSGGGKKWMAY